jgi:DNA-nicking Smr family endonuclease
MRIDLHGYHIHEGWRKFKQAIDDAYLNNYRRVTVITGQGAMMKELPTWADNHPRIREVKQPHKHNPGSFTIILTKKT